MVWKQKSGQLAQAFTAASWSFTWSMAFTLFLITSAEARRKKWELSDMSSEADGVEFRLSLSLPSSSSPFIVSENFGCTLNSAYWRDQNKIRGRDGTDKTWLILIPSIRWFELVVDVFVAGEKWKKVQCNVSEAEKFYKFSTVCPRKTNAFELRIASITIDVHYRKVVLFGALS